MTLRHICSTGVLCIGMSFQPLFKYAIDHCVVNDEQWIIRRGSNIHYNACLIRREDGIEVSLSSYEMDLQTSQQSMLIISLGGWVSCSYIINKIKVYIVATEQSLMGLLLILSCV